MTTNPEQENSVETLHGDVDREVLKLVERHEARLRCGPGCRACCVDGITVFEIEAARIRRRHADLLARGRPHPAGACAFLDERDACRIYEDRPYVCRTQGLPLRWLSEEDDGQTVELRDICPLNDLESEPIERLPPEDCWTLGPHEQRLAALQERSEGGPGGRIHLRDLFGPG